MVTIWWQQLFLVMCGGAVGSAARFWLGGALLRRLGDGLPWGTLAANLLGSFAIGYLAVFLEGRGQHALFLRAFLIVGLLGGLTTYSSLMLECVLLARSPRSATAMVYLAISLSLGLILVWAGMRTAALTRNPF